jgi:NADH-quinone oxidoreductase subunit C
LTSDQPAAGESLARVFGEHARAEEAFGQVTVDLPPHDWTTGLRRARDELGFTYFDWLTAVDQLDAEVDPGFDVVVHLWSVEQRQHLLLRTRVPAAAPTLPTATTVFKGAAWHERETFEMFGLTFDGHPRLVPLLLPDGFEGHPMRKDFVLAARAAKAWPGAKEPGESDAEDGRGGAPSRRKTRPPGVPDPETWGPRRPTAATADELPGEGS